MGWKDQLAQGVETIILPWAGGKHLRSGARMWTLESMPREHGWYEFAVTTRRTAVMNGPADPQPDLLSHLQLGYLAGDLLVPSGTSLVYGTVEALLAMCPYVHLIESGLPRFCRISAGRTYENGPLFYRRQEMGCGAEEEVTAAFQERRDSADSIGGVPPALRVAFRVETWKREQTERRRREEQERREKEERRKRLVEQLGDGAGRRQMARVDFAMAARAALAIGGAEYLDHRPSVQAGEMVVTYRLLDRRFECVCNEETLGIIDSGICLRNEATGERGDDRFTLESLPGVVQQAHRERRLVVFRHVDDDYGGHDDPEEDW
jgi:hypothetical protein